VRSTPPRSIYRLHPTPQNRLHPSVIRSFGFFFDMYFSIRTILWLQPILHLVSGITVDPTSQGGKISKNKQLICPCSVVNGSVKINNRGDVVVLRRRSAWSNTRSLQPNRRILLVDGRGCMECTVHSNHKDINCQAIMQYWWLTGDSEYNDLVTTAMMYYPKTPK
jgi:hypothetical protein